MPQEKRWLAADNVALLVDHIHTLRVRGAPLIGLSASLLLALLAQRGLNRDALQQALETLRAARPTAVNLMNNLGSHGNRRWPRRITRRRWKRKPCVWSKKINSCATASLRRAVRW